MTGDPLTWLRRQATTCPDKPALITPAGVTHYSSLYAHVRQLAAHFLEYGLDPEQPLAVISRSRETIIRFAGLALYLDCPFLPLSPDQTAIEHILVDTGIRQVLTHAGVMVPPPLRRFDIDLPAMRANPSPATPPAPASTTGFQLLMTTSGTTGTPKVAALSRHNIAASVLASRKRLGLGPEDIWLNCLPVTHVGGFMIFPRCLEAAAAMLLLENFNPEQLGHVISKNLCTHVSLVPAMLAQLLDADVRIPPRNRLRVALVGGGPLDEQLARRAIESGWPLCTAYGMTETTSHVCLNMDIASNEARADAGVPVGDARIDIVRQEGTRAGRTGRIRVRGSMVMSGYMRNGELDTRPVKQGFLSGDLGYLDNEGHLHVTGRADDMLVSGGTNVHPVEIERLLQQCPGIREIGITSIPDPAWGDRLVACVAADSSLKDIEHWCRKHLPGHLRPRSFRLINALPRNAAGKLDRHRLRECAINHSNDTPEQK